MTKEQALEKKLEQMKWQFPNHVVFKHNNRVYHFDPNNVDEDNIFSQTGLKVFKEKDGNVALYDPKYFRADKLKYLVYHGSTTKNIPQPINLKSYRCLFYECECKEIDLSDWDFSEVVLAKGMFAASEMKVVMLGSANFSKCVNYVGCFLLCSNLEEIVFGDYRTTQGADVDNMFGNCTELTYRYNKTAEELANIFKSGKWNSLQQKMEVF